jgi:hypothetical protein
MKRTSARKSDARTTSNRPRLDTEPSPGPEGPYIATIGRLVDHPARRMRHRPSGSGLGWTTRDATIGSAARLAEERNGAASDCSPTNRPADCRSSVNRCDCQKGVKGTGAQRWSSPVFCRQSRLWRPGNPDNLRPRCVAGYGAPRRADRCLYGLRKNVPSRNALFAQFPSVSAEPSLVRLC